MHLKMEADLPPLDETSDGVVLVSGTRIPLERVVRAFLAGAWKDKIVYLPFEQTPHAP